jgi:hypothetical protein
MANTNSAQITLRILLGVMAVVFEALYLMGNIGFETTAIVLLSIACVLLSAIATDGS